MCRRGGSSLVLALGLAGAWGSCGGRGDRDKKKTVESAPPAGPPSFAALAERLMPSVVGVVEGGDPVTGLAASGATQDSSLGSGFVVDARGHVVTNRHVIGLAKRVWVQSADGQRHLARVVGHDDQTDLAVLVVESERKLPPAPLGDSDTLAVGDWVVAAGSPFGLGHSFTAGIVSAKGRRHLMEVPGYWDFIQTDAAINPGNSGGPLVDVRGRVVGISAAMRSDAHGIGFAIPVNTLKAVLPGLIRDGRVARSWIGLFIDQVEEQRDVPDAVRSGAVVSALVEGGPAERADVRTGDVILTFDGHRLARADDLPWLVSTASVGKSVVMRIWRDGSERDLGIQTMERPADAP